MNPLGRTGFPLTDPKVTRQPDCAQVGNENYTPPPEVPQAPPLDPLG